MAKTVKKTAAPVEKTKTDGGKTGGLIDAGKYDYERTKIKTEDGKSKVVVDNGDRLAKMLRGKTIAELGQVAKDNGIEFDVKRYVNVGLARMALGNKIRGAVRKGEAKVKIDGQTVASL